MCVGDWLELPTITARAGIFLALAQARAAIVKQSQSPAPGMPQ